MAEKIKCDCGITFEIEEGQTHCKYCGIKLLDIGKEKPAGLAKEDKVTLGEKKKGRGCLIVIGLLIGFFILIAAISDGGKKEKSTPTSTSQPPVSYEIGYTSGMLATISVPKGTTNSQLKELLNYFHLLSQKGELYKIMEGKKVIDIFDDKKWTTKENYDSLTQGMQYCDHIKATYSIGIDGVERAGISEGNCPNYEEVIKPSSPTPTSREDFRVSVEFTGTQFVISNLDDSDCQNAKMEINGGIFKGGYVLEGYVLETGETYEVGALQFAKSDGTRFNPFEIKPKSFFIMCKGENTLSGAGWFGEF